MPEFAFTADELETLSSIFDTIIQAVPVETLLELAPHLKDDVDAETIAAFAAEVPSKSEAYQHEVKEVLPTMLSDAKKAELRQVVGVLRSPVAMFILSGGSCVPFHKRSVKQREELLLSWKMSRLPLLRRIYDSLAKVSNSIYMRTSTLAHKAMLFEQNPVAPPDDGHYQFKFVTPTDLDKVTLDAIIVGSGSGGGVAAKMLAEAGLKVLVIERGRHYDLSDTHFKEREGLQKMYDRAAYSTNDYGDLALISGKTWGGGSAVNWAASLQPPATVRKDWASNGLPYFDSDEFQGDLDAVCEEMGVSAPTSQNIPNTLLLEGARRKGYQHAPVPQNNGGVPHGCDHGCAYGCRSGGKKGGVHSWLIDAAEAGAVFMQDTAVRSIIFGANKEATGVIITTPEGAEATLIAPRVIVAGGSLESPALLLRSKLTGNKMVGVGLHLHPTNYIHAVFPQHTHPTSGQILTSVVGEAANLTPSGHGVRIETGIMTPGVGMSLLQWQGGAQHKANLSKHSHMAGLISICRDRDYGRVRIDAQGDPVIDYTTSPFDTRSIIKGTILGVECMKEMGAEEILVAARGVAGWKKGDDWDAWIKLVNSTPLGGAGSAHQMASNRMAASPKTGTCDPEGRVYGVKGVWVADASVLPSASGVNPMVTTMAVARKVARGIVEDAKPAAKL